MSNKKPQQKFGWQKPSLPVWPIVAIAGGLAMLGLVIYAVWAAVAPATASGPKVPVEVQGAPSLKADKEKVDLGDIPLGQTVKVEFQIANVGDRQLRVSEQPYVEVVEGCCPPEAAIGSMVLNPGETTTLSLQFMMHEGMGGYHNFSVHIPSNDPAQPDKTLTVLSNWIQ